MNGTSRTSNNPSRFILFSKGRTASNLLMRILNLDEQPGLLQGEPRDYYFFDVMAKRAEWNDEHPSTWTEEQKDERMHNYQVCADAFDGHVKRAEAQGKNVWVKEHVSILELRLPDSFDEVEKKRLTVNTGGATKTRTSNVIFSDEYLKTWRATFLIRHPALCFPSMYRALSDVKVIPQDAMTFDMHLHSTRALYDWYVQQNQASDPAVDSEIFPLVLDAEDVITRPDVLVAFAKQAGLDPEKLKFSWEKGQVDFKQSAADALTKRFLSTLTDSKGVDLSKAPKNIDIDVEAAKWRKEFGEEAGANIEKLVRDTMPDYEYLRARRLQADKPNGTTS